MKRTGMLALVAVLATGCASTPDPAVRSAAPSAAPSAGASGVAKATSAPPVSGTPRTLTGGLRVPWAIAFLPGGDALVTERDSGKLLRVSPDGKTADVGVIDGVSASGEGGLLGVAVSPSYEEDRAIYVYFTAASDNRVVRYTYDSGLSDPKPILTGIPKGGIHNGGRLAFGPDGQLYVATGEVGDSGLSQDKSSLAGKILRMTGDGKPAPGNPFGDSLVWSLGHRNVQGLAWDDTGAMYATEFGQNTYDELNLIKPGVNYGWPEVEGEADDDRFQNPIAIWTTDEASPSGLAYAAGSLWMAALRGERLWQIPVNDGKAGKPVAYYEGEYGRLRAVAATPGGELWLGTSNHDGRGDAAEDDDRILIVKPG